MRSCGVLLLFMLVTGHASQIGFENLYASVKDNFLEGGTELTAVGIPNGLDELETVVITNAEYTLSIPPTAQYNKKYPNDLEFRYGLITMELHCSAKAADPTPCLTMIMKPKEGEKVFILITLRFDERKLNSTKVEIIDSDRVIVQKVYSCFGVHRVLYPDHFVSTIAECIKQKLDSDPYFNTILPVYDLID